MLMLQTENYFLQYTASLAEPPGKTGSVLAPSASAVPVDVAAW